MVKFFFYSSEIFKLFIDSSLAPGNKMQAVKELDKKRGSRAADQYEEDMTPAPVQ
jgi:hypothetical protein